jgi:RNA polymerase sigma factor (sigma-70 family)
VPPRPFDDIVAEHGQVVMRVCRALLTASDADDAWSETFLAALRAYPELRPDSNIRGWLVTIAHRKAIDVLRRRARDPAPRDQLPEPAAEDDHAAVEQAPVRAALAELPPKQRAAVVYRYLADLSYAEVGDLMATSEAAARRNAADGIAHLRRRFAEGAA